MTAAYVPSLSHMLHMVAPDIKMWGIVLAMSLAPLLVDLILRSLLSMCEDQKISAKK